MIELEACDRLIKFATIGNAGIQALISGRSYSDEAPLGTAFPVIISSVQTTSDDLVVNDGPNVVRTDLDYLIKVVTRTREQSYVEAYALMRLVHASLSNVAISGPYNIAGVYRNGSVIRYRENIDGAYFNHVGAPYRFVGTG